MQVQLDGTGGRLEDGAADDDEGRNDDDCGADDGGREDDEDMREEDATTVLDGGTQEDAPTLPGTPVLELPPETGLNAEEPCAPLESMDAREDDDGVGLLLLLTSRRRQLQEPQVPSPPHTWTPAPPWGQAQFCVSPAAQSWGPQASVPHTASRIVPPNNKTRRMQHLLTSGV